MEKLSAHDKSKDANRITNQPWVNHKGSAMMKSEFEKMIEKQITSENYEVIEAVYMDYPAENSNGLSKKDVVILYNTFGMRIFKDMLNRAREVKMYRDAIQDATVRIGIAQSSINLL